MSNSLNEVKISGVVATDPKQVSNNVFKFTVKTTEVSNNGKTVHAFIPVAGNQKVSKGDIVTVTGKITTASQKHEDGTYSNYWNVLASNVTNQGERNQSNNYYQQTVTNSYDYQDSDSLTKAANKIKNYKVNQSNKTKQLTDDKKEKALELAKQLLAEYGE